MYILLITSFTCVNSVVIITYYNIANCYIIIFLQIASTIV